MWWRTAWPKTRSKLSSSKGSSSASVATVSASRPRSSAVAARRCSIPGEMSVAVSRSIDPELQQVEREVAGAGADLEPVAEAGAVDPAAQRLGQLQPHLLLAGLAEVDAPLGVVFVGRGVVVAGVDVLDVLGRGGGGGRHRAGTLRGLAQSTARRAAIASRPWSGVRAAQPARRGAAAAADRRADAARRARGELLVPAPPGRLRVDRGAGRRHAGRRHGLRRGLRLRPCSPAAAPRAWSASTPTPRPTSTPACATCGPTCASSATWSRASPSPATRSSSCRRSSTSRTPGAILEHFKSMLGPGGVAYVSTPNLLTLAPPGAEKSDNPWHVQASTARRSSASSARRTSTGSSCSASSTPASCAPTSSRSSSAGTASTRRLASPSPSTTASPRRSPPPTSASRAGTSTRALDFLAVCHA